MFKSESLKSESSRSKWLPSNSSKSNRTSRMRRTGIAAIYLLTAALALLSPAWAQNVTLQATSFTPPAVAPGGTTASDITVGAINGFTGTVDLGCTVSSTATMITDPPVCTVSPSTVTPNASASATITTKTDTSTVGYTITISATPSSGTAPIPVTLSLTVLAVTPTFTITVEKAVSPSSVTAGSGGVATVTINPINGYTSPSGSPGVTLSCASITPLVTIPPVCSFNKPVIPVNGEAISSTLTISTFGPIITGANAPPANTPRNFYALWMPLPLLALVGLGAAIGGPSSKTRKRKVWALLGLFVVGGAFFLMPACGNTTASTTTPNGVTPANTYTFTLMGVDSNGVISSNTGSTTGGNPTVSLTVTAPKTN